MPSPSDMPGAAPDYEKSALIALRLGDRSNAIIFALLNIGDRLDAILAEFESQN